MTGTLEGAAPPARILIVDDDAKNRKLLEAMLSQDGFDLRAAASGEEALKLVAQEVPDLILLDLMMPGMDGHEVAARIKAGAATQDVPIVMVTSIDDRNTRLLALGAGAEHFLTKPVDRAELRVRVRHLLRQKAFRDDQTRYSQRLEADIAARTADLLERTRTLEEQAAALTDQAALLDLAQDAIIVRDMDGRILSWSRGAEATFGWRSEEALGRRAKDLLQPEYSEPFERIESTLLREGWWEGEAIKLRRDGTAIAVASRWTLQRSADGRPRRILTINNDISSRKRADAELRMLTERLSLATAVAQVGVWEWDVVTDVLVWDSTMFQIYGLPEVSPVLYEQWAAAVAPEHLPAAEANLQSTIERKGESATEFRIDLADGSSKTVAAVQKAILDERGMVRSVIGVNMDITARRASEQALERVRQDQMRFKDEFLSHVSHELRSPLTAIKQFTSILVSGVAGELNGEQLEYQQIVMKNIEQLQSMIDDLLQVTRLETGKLTVEPECVSLSLAVRDSLDTLRGVASAKGIDLSSKLAPALPAAYADETRLRQILIILLDNAIKFTPEGGVVQVRAQLHEQEPGFLLVEVADSGCGIAAGSIDTIFERLYQVSERNKGSRKGLGLGLYICKELVTRQGGRIWVASSEGEGSTFSFTLPVFSLSDTLVSLVRNGELPSESVALVHVETSLSGAWPSKESEDEWGADLSSLLRRCLLPDLDVLLPRMHGVASGKHFFIAAFADAKGAAVLVNRVREQIQRLPVPAQTGLVVTVSYSMLGPVERQPGVSLAGALPMLALQLENEMKALAGALEVERG